MPPIWLPIALVAYLVGLFLAGLATFYRLETARTLSTMVFGVAWFAHGAAVIRLGVKTGRFPLNSQAEYLLVLGFAVMTLFLLLWLRWRVQAASVLLPPVAASAVFGALALPGGATADAADSPSGWFLFHTTVSTLAMATLVVALAMSLIYLFADRALKAKRTLKLLDRLPTLARCDQLGFQALIAGFVLLSVGIAAGVVVNADIHDRFWVPGVKQTPAMLAWIIFAGVLAARLRLGFRGRKSAYLTIAGVMLGLMTMVGMAV
jgi:ABC-type uncharacterized transport system permease subunit